MRFLCLFRSFVSCGVAIAISAAATAADLRVLASNAVKEGYAETLPRFEAESHNRVAVEWGGTVDIVRRIRAGEPVDVVVVPAPSIDELIREGWLAPGSRTDLVKSRIGAAVRPGLAIPALSSAPDLKASVLAARSIVLSSGPSSLHLEKLFEGMGIAADVKAKTLKLKPGASVAEALQRSEGDLGFTQVSELVTHAGIGYAGPLPDEAQAVTVFSSGTVSKSHHPEASRRLANWMTGADVRATLRRVGLEPY